MTGLKHKENWLHGWQPAFLFCNQRRPFYLDTLKYRCDISLAIGTINLYLFLTLYTNNSQLQFVEKTDYKKVNLYEMQILRGEFYVGYTTYN